MHQASLLTPLLIPWLLLLGSCGSPPKPPTVDESLRRPVNSAAAVDLQTCRSDLANTRILANETTRVAESTAASLQQLVANQQALTLQRTRPAEPTPNSIYTLRFEFGSSRVAVPAELSAALLDEAKTAPLVVVRGRTDGVADTPAESRVARDRASAVRDYLVAAGVGAERVRATYQPAGDHAADNGSAEGRASNRRVEVEIYRSAPVAVGAASQTPALHGLATRAATSSE